MCKSYFDRPTQVVFADPDNSGNWISGIAYRDEIICSCCGGVFNIDDVIEMGCESGVKCAIYEYTEWMDLSGELIGGELPEGLSYCIDGIVETRTEEDVEYEQHHFLLDEEDEEQATAFFANTWVDGVAMPSID